MASVREKKPLHEEIADLRAENRRLKKRLAFFENHPAIAQEFTSTP